MAYGKRETRKKIIKEIFENGSCTAAYLAERTGVSRATVLKEMSSLCQVSAAVKSGSGYRLNGSAALVMLKTYENGGELRACTFDGGIISGQSLDFSPMLSYGQNLVGAAEIADRYADFLKKNYSTVILCHIYGANVASYPLPDIFSAISGREALLARSLKENYGEGSCIFVSKKSGIYLLCADGKAIAPERELKGDTFEKLCGYMALFSPHTLVLEGAFDQMELESAEKSCKENGVRLFCGEASNTLSADEREMLFEALLSLM